MFCLLAWSPLAMACRILVSGMTCLSPRLTLDGAGAAAGAAGFLSGFCSTTGAAAGGGVNASTSF